MEHPLHRTEIAALIFGESGRDYLPVLDAFRGSLRGEYSFLDLALYTELVVKNPVEAARTYWKEMLFRAHLAASVSILRHSNWVEGALVGFQRGNLLSCAACVRGLLESVADADDALRVVPNVLAEFAPVIRRALEGRLPVLLVQDTGLESKLIHFTHARKPQKGEALPLEHHARTTQDYLKYFAGEKHGEVGGLYRVLCELTHPAAGSVNLFVDTDIREADTLCWLREIRDGDEFLAVLAPYVGVMPDMFRLGVNTPVLILKVLNSLPLSEIHNPVADLMVLEGAEWTEMSAKLSSASIGSTLPNIGMKPTAGGTEPSG